MDETLVLEMLAAGAEVNVYNEDGLQQSLRQCEDGRFIVIEGRWEYADGFVPYWDEKHDTVSAAWQAMKEWAAQPEEKQDDQ